MPAYRKLLALAGGGDLEARFLSTWCPPRYLGGCSLAALAESDAVRLVRNYDLSLDLNEGLLLKSEWTGRPVMGMVEFLWGLSDGINVDGLAVAFAYGGRTEVAPGFGITTILRHVLETCASVDDALNVLRSVPSHMAYNIVLADREGRTAVVELSPGGGMRRVTPTVAANHQHGAGRDAQSAFTGSSARLAHLNRLLDDGIAPAAPGDAFLEAPLHQQGYAAGFGTLFTAVYDPRAGGLVLRWPDENWVQSLDRFAEGRREIRYGPAPVPASRADLPLIAHAMAPFVASAAAEKLDRWQRRAPEGDADWIAFGAILAEAYGPKTARVSTSCR